MWSFWRWYNRVNIITVVVVVDDDDDDDDDDLEINKVRNGTYLSKTFSEYHF